MAIRKKLIKRLKRIQEELNIPHIPITRLENLSIETRKAFDESIKYLMVKRGLFKKVKVRRDYLKLWRHRENQIVLPINWRYILSIPFIYGMIVPAIVWNLGLEIYHQICFPIYKINKVKRSEYILILDRNRLQYLNPIEKVGCMYCGYANGVVEYLKEIANRTEKYWCGVIHQSKSDFKIQNHQLEKNFSKFDDEKDFKDKYVN